MKKKKIKMRIKFKNKKKSPYSKNNNLVLQGQVKQASPSQGVSQILITQNMSAKMSAPISI